MSRKRSYQPQRLDITCLISLNPQRLERPDLRRSSCRQIVGDDGRRHQHDDGRGERWSIDSTPSTIRVTRPGSAPTAARMPNSLVRWLVEYDVTPYRPSAASTSVTMQKKIVTYTSSTSCDSVPAHEVVHQ
jgi:hypothetical protein